MTINERFERIINALYNGNKRAFATSIGVSATVVENVVGKRQGKPSYDVLVAICAYANISAHWLLTGEGEMLRGEVDKEIKRGVDDSLDVPLSDVGKESSSAEVIAYLVGVIQRQAEEIGCLKNMLNK